MRILFMGTPDFARIHLQAIYESGEQIVGVVTTPDKPKGRGMVLTPSDVKKYALEKGLKVYQPATLKNGAFEQTLKELDPELIIVVAYGKLLPEYVLEYPKYCCINAHASILPKYRGAAPMQRAIIDGEEKTGVSIMRMDAGLDTGDVITVKEITIEKNDNFENVHDKLAVAGSEGILEAIKLFKDNKATYTKQDGNFTYAEKITKEDCYIGFDKASLAIHNKIRGLSPIPLAFTKTSDGKLLKLVKAHISDKDADAKVGEVIALDSSIHVKCAEGAIALDIIVPEGKGKMNAKDYINGRKISLGDILG
ncbi:MAG: methionyl-tRNA formyltransferase [Clostridia bacterium]|nr:methionyl-tRNA formyltransferase [Clostridia bacterium]